MIAEHLAAISVIALAIMWLGGIITYAHAQLDPIRQQVSAFQAANTALVTGESQVIVAGQDWEVEVKANGVQVVNRQTHVTQTIRRDHD
ncbi:hypothetical protein [Lacticaseibacillus porcinae]|uniref:hypothetical protein n=1 Tax=Lacticaseibacillus porcinae TaxID=1123687 RepID=UPI000F7AD711|nr:hypothetical protein [Lacticaseibacillus porcinae]